MRKFAITLSIVIALGSISFVGAQIGIMDGQNVFLPLAVKAEDTPVPTIEPTPIQPTTVPTVPPTAVPSNKVVVVSSSAFSPYSGSKSVYVVGEVRNETTSNVESIKINGILRDANGGIVDSDYSYSYVGELTPGLVSPFRLIFSNVPAYTTYELTVTWSKGSGSIYELQTSGIEPFFDTSDAYHVRGVVKNQYAVKRTFVQLFLTMYDSNNTVIGVEEMYTNPTELEPNQEVPFDIDAYFWNGKPDRSKVVRYVLRAFDD